jgi:hypothetical protein
MRDRDGEHCYMIPYMQQVIIVYSCCEKERKQTMSEVSIKETLERKILSYLLFKDLVCILLSMKA